MTIIHDRRGQSQGQQPEPALSTNPHQAPREFPHCGLWISLDITQRNFLIRSARWPAGSLVARLTYEQISSLTALDWHRLAAKAARRNP
jgi:hypothetical protein